MIARDRPGRAGLPVGVPGRGEATSRPPAPPRRSATTSSPARPGTRTACARCCFESCPALEAAVDLSDRRWLELLAGFGGAWGIARSGAGGPRAEAAGEAAAASTAPLLEGDETYACLLTVPGIGPRTAAQLAVSVDIGRFPDHDHLASYCGIAPRVRSSGTSVRSVRASRRGDARLKSLLIFSCNSLVRSSGRYGEYYRACRARGMGHGRALKAVARKRLRAIYAVMRDRVPYRE